MYSTYRGTYRDESWKSILIFGVVGVLLVGGLIYLFAHRETRYISIVKREWVTSASVTYTETHLVPVTHTSCDAKGKCTTSTTLQTRTYTHTRCQGVVSDTELPVYAPKLKCQATGRDRYHEHTEYHLTYYRLDDKKHKEQRHNFDGALWDKFAPGARRSVITNIFGTVYKLSEE